MNTPSNSQMPTITPEQREILQKKKPVVAISGKSGCGNTTVTTMAAQALGFTMINYTFRNLAKDLDLPLMDLIDKAKTDPQYDRQVDKRQVELARPGNTVLGSRLAVWVYPEADLKVYLTADSKTRAQRIHNREGGDLELIQIETQKRDQEDRQRYLELYHIDNDDYGFVDLVIDTAQFLPEEIVDQIIKALFAKLLW